MRKRLNYIEELACSVAFIAFVGCPVFFASYGYGCNSVSGQNPPVEFDPKSHVSIGPDALLLVTESFQHSTPPNRTGPITNFPLSTPVVVDSVTGNYLYYGPNGSCDGRDIAIVGSVGNGRSELLPFTLVTKGDKALTMPVSATFGAGVPISVLSVQLYDDLCHDTNFRIFLSFHRVK